MFRGGVGGMSGARPLPDSAHDGVDFSRRESASGEGGDLAALERVMIYELAEFHW
jgi:hypothetical protein